MKLSPIDRGWMAAAVGLVLLVGCDSGGREASANATVESCQQCHNGARHENYSGPGIENPHPFAPADNLACTTCHGGNPDGVDKDSSHVPPPPQIGDRDFQDQNATAYFNKLTLAGMDKFPDYTVDGTTYRALDYLQFVNPGDLRVVTESRACGMCHKAHADCVAGSPLATSTDIFSGAMFAAGVENAVPEHRGLYQDTAADLGFRPVTDTQVDADSVGAVGSLVEYPVYSKRNDLNPLAIHNNAMYDRANLAGQNADGTLERDSAIANLYHEQVAFTCGDCHLGSAGANNRAGDFRSSGCTSCHMQYSLGGRSGSKDPNVPKNEPADPDDIDDPERPHVRAHRIASIAKTLPSGIQIKGIDDYACAGCHQGSNRTVMQYWGIRLDQNEDLRRRVQYPLNPKTWKSTSGDKRLFDPAVGNHTFNGRNRNQYVLEEDYDGDGRDDTPADVHYEAGMGCIDCHGSFDLHGGNPGAADRMRIPSRMEQAVAIQCENCHGSAADYAPTVDGTGYDGTPQQVGVDGAGNPLRHVVREADGNVYLYSRLTGQKHFVPQTRDVVVNSGKTNPFTGTPLYSDKASFAMGRDDGDMQTGLGPHQTGAPTGFSHGDNLNCAACHASWTNTCMGCHLEGEYNNGNNFSNVTGDRIVFRERNADFVYQSPLFFQLGVNARNKITQTSSNTKVFFKWRDRNGVFSRVYAFSDRNGGGAAQDPERPFPSLSHNALMAHSIRGRVTGKAEGPRYCVACHLTTDGLDEYGALYEQFRAAMASNDFAQLDFDALALHFGENTSNRKNSPLFVHMAAGLGTGLFLFDDNGAPENPLDQDPQRAGAEGVAPFLDFEPNNVAFNLDRIVDESGASTGSNNHAMLGPPSALRDGATDAALSGPMGATLIERLADPLLGIRLDSWLNADGAPEGGAGAFVGTP
jgi:hypothetical protein